MQRQINLPAAKVTRTIRYRMMKRAFDFVIASLLLVCLAPLFLLCALLVCVSSRGPILFRQQRVGLLGHEFVFLKFRSMYVNADDTPHRTYVASVINGNAKRAEAGDRPIYKIAHDPRVTPIGRWLRKTSLDELPQLWNVVCGDMSLVGPRPPIPYELENYLPRHRQRLAVKPGITGLWQVSGRSETTFEEMVQLDLDYIARASLWFDLTILCKTVPAVLAHKAA